MSGSFTEQLRERVKQQADRTSVRSVAAYAGVDHTALSRFLKGRAIRSDTIDSLLDYLDRREATS